MKSVERVWLVMVMVPDSETWRTMLAVKDWGSEGGATFAVAVGVAAVVAVAAVAEGTKILSNH